MKQNKKKSFATLAKEIQNKYKRSKFDPIEQADMEAELQALMKEQEAVRESMGLTQPQEGMPQEFKSGGPTKPLEEYSFAEKYQRQVTNNATIGRDTNFGNNFVDRISANPLFTEYDTSSILARKIDKTPYLSPRELAQTSQPRQRPNQRSSVGQTQRTNRVGVPPVNQSGVNRNPNERWMANEADMVANNISNKAPSMWDRAKTPAQVAANQKIEIDKLQTNSTEEDNKQSFWDKNKEYLPYAISGLSNIASNLLLANMAKKNQPRMSAAMSTPERINLEPKAEMLRQQAGVSKNVAARNARDLGLNPMQAMAGMSASGAGVDRALGEALTNLYMGQEQFNVGAANQFNLANMQSRQRADMYNMSAAQQSKENELGFLSGAMGTIPGVMRDIRADKADKETRDMYSAYYKSMGRNYMNEGDIWDNPRDGFRYVVRNNELIKVGKSK